MITLQLPQFRPILQNAVVAEFTEWTNVPKVTPLFPAIYSRSRLPIAASTAGRRRNCEKDRPAGTPVARGGLQRMQRG